MPTIEAFRGLRYDLGHVGALENVVAPPYDVIGPDLHDELQKKHPANVIRLILNREEPGDAPDEKYGRAARFLKNWREEGVLQREPDPALYVYHQVFQHEGNAYIRRGFMARTRLEPFGQGTIYPHEETHASAKEDRLKLTRACRANLSQIFGLYPDPENVAQAMLETAIIDQAPIEARDHLGVVHRLWPVTDVKVIGEVAAVMANKPTFIADGHHRYETACNYRDEIARSGPLDASHPVNYVLMMCVSMNDPGMIVLPTHRLFRGLPRLNAEQLVSRLGECFDVQIAEPGLKGAETIWQGIESSGDQGTVGLFTPSDQRWLVAKLTDAGRNRMADIAPEHSEVWQALGVSILHRLIVETLLDAKELPKPEYVHLVRELVEGIEADDDFSMAALVMPATLDHIRAISSHGERMPAKSTYFYPKLLSGLVINPHD